MTQENSKHHWSSWLMSIVAVLLAALCIKLGFWQRARANEKQIMQQSMIQQASRVAKVWMPHEAVPTQYQRLQVQGEYLPSTLYLDNQHYEHQFGYDIISPLKLLNGKILLINRGWIKGDITRQQLPKINIPRGKQTLSGYAYFPSDKSWLLGPVIERNQEGDAVVELLDLNAIQSFLKGAVEPFSLRLAPHEPNGFVRAWAITSMPPARHQAYALQWFAFAVIAGVAAVFFLSQSMKK